ncbi:hypothetical protein D3C81_1211810 [compost metagenome]
MGLLMARASRNNPAFKQQLKDKNLVFQMQTLDGKIARHFIVSDERISSKGGAHPQPAFAIAFKDAAYGFATLQAGNKQLAFMQGIQDKNIQIKGNPALVMWFQGLMKYLKPKKKR